jgi:hypothetical protein
MASRAAEEDMELVGGADDCDDDAEILPHPSRKIALEAAAILERYISLIEEPYAPKLKGLLFTFGHRTCFEEPKIWFLLR